MAPVLAKASARTQILDTVAAARPQGITKSSAQAITRKSARLIEEATRRAIVPAASVSATLRPYDSKKGTKRKHDHLEDDPIEHSSKRRHQSSGLVRDNCSAQDFSIDHWRRQGRWPKELFEHPMVNILARRKSSASIGRKRYNDGSTISSQTTNGKTRDEKSAPYKSPQYEEQLQLKGFFMKDDPGGPEPSSIVTCKRLRDKQTTVPPESLFADDVFAKTCDNLHGRNEARVIADIRPLIVPSAEALASGDISMEHLVEAVDEGWNQTDPITTIRPQPDFSVGFKRTAFTEQQLEKIRPILGDSQTEVSLFRATWYMYFPFLTCEVKSGMGGLEVADRQNAHSAGIATRAIFELFKLAKRAEEVDRNILAFSVSHSDMDVRIYGYYPLLKGENVTYHRRSIEMFNFQAREGLEKWTTYKFVKNVYQHWAPDHLKRIRSVLDALPEDITSLTAPSTQYTGLSQQVDSSHISEDAAGSSVGADSEVQEQIEPTLPQTPETSVSVSQIGSRQKAVPRVTRANKHF